AQEMLVGARRGCKSLCGCVESRSGVPSEKGLGVAAQLLWRLRTLLSGADSERQLRVRTTEKRLTAEGAETAKSAGNYAFVVKKNTHVFSAFSAVISFSVSAIS